MITDVCFDCNNCSDFFRFKWITRWEWPVESFPTCPRCGMGPYNIGAAEASMIQKLEPIAPIFGPPVPLMSKFYWPGIIKYPIESR